MSGLITRPIAERWRSVHCGVALAIALVCVCGSSAVRAATPTPDEVMTATGFSAAEKKAVFSGEVVSRNVKRIAPNEVVAVLVLRLPIPFAEVFRRYSHGKDLEASPHHLALGQIDTGSPLAGWQEARFASSEIDEVHALLAVVPGLDFNLSATEISELQAQRGVAEAEQVERTSGIYRRILQDRMQAYLAKGLDGMAPYAREKGESTSAADEIQRVWRADAFIRERFPLFFQAMEAFPNDQASVLHHEFFWVKQRFESQWSTRPAFTLEHYAWLRAEDYILVSGRQFFVGHSYNANQGLTLVLPYEDDVIVFHQMDVTSDLAARYVSWIAMPIAQKIMRSELERFYRGLSEAESGEH